MQARLAKHFKRRGPGADAHADGRRMRALVDQLGGALIESEPGADAPRYVGRRIEALLGYRIDRWLDSWELWSDRVHPDDRETYAGAVRARERGERIDTEYRVLAADQRVVWLRHQGQLQGEPGQQPVYATVLTDVSERQSQQEKLERTIALFRATLEATADGILVVDEHGNIAGFNPRFVEMWSIPETVLTPGQNGQALDHVLDQLVDPEAFVATVQRMAETPEAESFDVIEFKDGRRFERYSKPQQIGAAAGRIWSFRDVTVRKRAEDALRESERSFRETLENMRLMALALDHEGRVTFCNDFLVEITGWTREELLGESWFDRALPDQPEAKVRYANALATATVTPYVKATFKTRNGETRYVSWNSTLLRDPSGRPIGVVSIGEDMTEAHLAEEALKRNEEQLQRAQKLEAVGRLAGGIAHDFNNLLTAINGYSEFMISQLDVANPLRQDAVEIQRAAERAAALTAQLLAFSRKQVLQPEVLSLNAVIVEVEKLLRRLIGEDIALTTSLAGRLSEVRADPGQLEQVIVNLAVNARDAMPSGGELTIETAEIDLLGALDAEGGTLSPGRYVTLTVSDTGSGIPEEARPHLFEPFFTTKEVGKGTGLGLATVFGIIKQSGGDMIVESRAGRTVFRIFLPVCAEGEGAIEQLEPRVDEGTTVGGETILLVEDEDVVRSLVRHILEREGYVVLEASDGIAALQLSRDFAGTIDLLLTDIVMPEMGGHELAEQMLEERRGIRVLYTSGYTDEAILHPTDATAFIAKPFTPDDLAAKVRDVLEGETASAAA